MRALLLALCLSAPAFAQERTHTVTPDDYFTLNTITELASSAAGTGVAYALATWDKAEDNRRSDIWVMTTRSKYKPIRLTFDRANDRHLIWSADGQFIYFLGNRKRAGETKPPYDGTTQVWRIDVTGGDPKAVTREAGGVSGYDYAPKADAVFFSKDKEHADQDEFAKLRAKAKLEYGHGARKVSEIHKLDVTAWRTEKVVDDTRYVREFAVTQDGKKIAMVSAFDDTVVKSEGESRVDIWDGGKVVTPPTDAYRKNPKNSPYAWLENLCWSPDGKHFAFTAVHDAFPSEVIIGSARTEGWDVSRLARNGWEVVGYGRGTGQPLQWFGGESSTGIRENERIGLSGLYEKSGVAGVFSVKIGEETEVKFLSAAKNILGIQRWPDGKDRDPLKNGSWFICSSPTHFPHLSSAKDESVLQDPNPHTATWKLPSVQHITWKAPDGSTVGGVLELPPGYKKGDKLPLVVAIHGGPTTSTKADLNFDPHNGRLYFATAGYAVLLPNYRGSTGYGDKFVTDLIGKENDIEVKDILAGIQHLVKEGIADPDRVGCMGWSNGGYLTNCLITLKDSPIKFKAASSGAGIVDTVAEWGFNDEPAYPIVFKKGLPWEQPEIYKKTSPTYQLGNVKTPTLIHVGGGDERCPPGHSRMLYRALKENLKVPTELIVYPGEPHGLTKYSNRKLKMEWDLAWFDKYLKGKK